MHNYWKNKVDAAEKRINEAVSKGNRANIHDLLIFGTNYWEVSKWFKNAYENLPDEGRKYL